MRSIWLSILLSLASVVVLSGCETLKGMGRDVESAGEEIDDAVDDE